MDVTGRKIQTGKQRQISSFNYHHYVLLCSSLPLCKQVSMGLGELCFLENLYVFASGAAPNPAVDTVHGTAINLSSFNLSYLYMSGWDSL